MMELLQNEIIRSLLVILIVILTVIATYNTIKTREFLSDKYVSKYANVRTYREDCDNCYASVKVIKVTIRDKEYHFGKCHRCENIIYIEEYIEEEDTDEEW